MKRAVMILLTLVSVAVFAQAPVSTRLAFSNYASGLRLASYDQATGAFTFSGNMMLTGTLFVEFDESEPNQGDGFVNFEKFVPDKGYLSELPAVVSGPYAEPVTFLSLDATDTQLAAVFGGQRQFARLSHGRPSTVSRRVRVVLSDYTTEVECDSREYEAHVLSISMGQEVGSSGEVTAEAPSGC
jgi:hypothetical protein